MLGRAQRMAADFRSDLERDLHNSELADLAKQVSDEEAQVRQQLAAVTAGMQQAVAEVESMHYGDPDPEPYGPSVSDHHVCVCGHIKV